MGLLVNLESAAKRHDLARAELKDLRRNLEQQQRALRVLYTWAGVPGALVPKHVQELAGKALGITPAKQRAGE